MTNEELIKHKQLQLKKIIEEERDARKKANQRNQIIQKEFNRV